MKRNDKEKEDLIDKLRQTDILTNPTKIIRGHEVLLKISKERKQWRAMIVYMLKECGR